MSKINVYCKFFQTVNGLEPIYFYEDRINISHFFPVTNEMGDDLAKELSSQGTYLVIRPPTSLVIMLHSQYFCRLEDIDEIEKIIVKNARPQVQLPRNADGKDYFKELKFFALKCIQQNRVEQTVSSFEAFERNVVSLSEGDKQRIKRRRNDVGEIIDIIDKNQPLVPSAQEEQTDYADI